MRHRQYLKLSDIPCDRSITRFVFDEIEENANMQSTAMIDCATGSSLYYGDLLRRVCGVQRRLMAETSQGCYEPLRFGDGPPPPPTTMERGDEQRPPQRPLYTESGPGEGEIPQSPQQQCSTNSETAIGSPPHPPPQAPVLPPASQPIPQLPQQPASQTVAVILSNRVEYAEVILALWASGFKVALLSTMYTQKELEICVKKLNIEYIIHEDDNFDYFKSSELQSITKCICITDICEPLPANVPVNLEGSHTSDNDPNELMDPQSMSPHPSLPGFTHFSAKDNVALYIFSSGTSGVPKAVCLTHYNVIAGILQHGVSDLNVADICLICQPPLSHIYGVCAVLLNNLSLGNRLLMPTKSDKRDRGFQLSSYLSLVQRYKVNMLHLTPPVIVMMLSFKRISEFDLSSVGQVLCGSATLTYDLQRKFAELLPRHAVVRQGYGLSEACGTHMCTAHQVLPGSIGKPLPLVQSKIIDTTTGLPVARGLSGELCIRGPQLMSGYYAIETSPIDDKGWLHTGDLAKVDENGNYFIVSRIKEIIKYNGHQISPVYLESVLLSHPAVIDVAAVGKDNLRCGHLPAAFVVVNVKVTQSLNNSIRNHVTDHMSQIYKLRGGLIFVEKIPKLANGKIQRNVLAKMLNNKSKL